MAYFKIGSTDYSAYVNSLKISRKANYNARTNAAGDTVVDYQKSKREIEVGLIMISNTSIMAALQTALEAFNVSISFRNQKTNALETGVSCIIPQYNIEYYTIQTNKVSYKAFTLKFIEL